ncbi:MAG TPA: hypothetical protein VIH99_12535 [Bdellovibrionota bacterium]|jgi:hypothetical protein
MSLAEQALFLLDIPPSALSLKNPENFPSLDQTIVESLPGMQALADTARVVTEANPFSVASRMRRPNYEDSLRSEALTQALKQIRASHVVARNSGQP